MSMNDTVIICGAGPAGMAIAHAANLAGRSFEIYSKADNHRFLPNAPAKSTLYGCQYLHRPIPITVESKTPQPVQVQFVQVGEPVDYMRKVYKTSWDGGTPSRLGTQHLAWDLRDLYDELWNRYGAFVQPATIDRDWLGFFAKRSGVQIFSTIPADQICIEQTHSFARVEVWGLGDAPELGQTIPYTELMAGLDSPELAANSVVCNGAIRPRWYRLSNVFGFGTVEWPGWENRPPIHPRFSTKGAVRVVKPLWTNCDCWPNVKKLGRRGAWHRREHIHTVYAEAARIFGLEIP